MDSARRLSALWTIAKKDSRLVAIQLIHPLYCFIVRNIFRAWNSRYFIKVCCTGVDYRQSLFQVPIYFHFIHSTNTFRNLYLLNN